MEKVSSKFPRRKDFSTELSEVENEILGLINDYRNPPVFKSISNINLNKFDSILEKEADSSAHEEDKDEPNEEINQVSKDFTGQLMLKLSLQACLQTGENVKTSKAMSPIVSSVEQSESNFYSISTPSP